MIEINYNEKIKQINDDRLLMLTTVKENIAKNNMALFNNLDNVIVMLEHDDKNTKKYKSILKAKQLIFELTKQIIDAKSVDEIINLRKKVNYYINKIKKEMENRNIAQEEFDKIYDNVDYLRNDMAKYIRFLKRDVKIKEIEELYNNVDNLSPESVKEFKKLLSNEKRYNKKNLLSINNYPQKKKEHTNRKKDNSVDKMTMEGSLQSVLDIINSENIPDAEMSLTLLGDSILENDDLSNLQANKNVMFKGIVLSDQVNRYLTLYRFSELTAYNGNFLTNSMILLKNIPKYIMNKKRIKSAEQDYNIFYHGPDLECFIDYIKKSNSIYLALEIIFKKSCLSNREIECLFDHQKCVDWIKEFCKEQFSEYELPDKLIRIK